MFLPKWRSRKQNMRERLKRSQRGAGMIGPETIFGLTGIILIVIALVFAVTKGATWATPTGLGVIGFGLLLAAFWKHLGQMGAVLVAALVVVGGVILGGHYAGWF
jgi:hypothetical protein